MQLGSCTSILEWLVAAFQLSGKKVAGDGDDNKPREDVSSAVSSLQGPSSAPLVPELRRFAEMLPKITAGALEEVSSSKYMFMVALPILFSLEAFDCIHNRVHVCLALCSLGHIEHCFFDGEDNSFLSL